MIDVYTDTPLNRSEFLLFELIKRIQRSNVHEVFGNTVLSSETPTPDDPATFSNVVYKETLTGHGTILRSVGNYKDKIYVDPINETAYIQRNVGVIEFDGTEDWIYYNPAGASHGLSYALTFTGAVNALNTSKCNYFTYLANAWDSVYADRIGVYTDHSWSGERYFRKPYADILTNDAFKAWLAERNQAGNPVTVYYALASTVTEQIEYIG